MEFEITFNYRCPGQDEPYDAIQDERIRFDRGDPIAIPNVGDTVDIMWGEKQKYFKVASRHFSFGTNFRGANIVVVDVEPDEMLRRVADL